MKIYRSAVALTAFAVTIAIPASPASAQEEEKAPRRTRVGLGAQVVPSYPGSDRLSVRPMVHMARSRDKPFAFEAPDDSFGFALIKSGGLGIGPALGFEGSRTAKDVGAPFDKVDTTFEAGAFIQYAFSEKFRIRAEGRKGLGGHDGWIGNLGADFVARSGDAWLFSIGPRVTVSDGSYNRAYFGVSAAEAVRTGLPAYRPDSGVQAVGATAGLITQLSKRWGIYSYAKYDRLVGDSGRSLVVRNFGSRDQLSGGLALTYTFGRGVK